MQYGVYITYTCDETDLGVIASTGSIAAHSAAAARNPGSRSPARPTIHISHHLVISNDIIVSRSICRQPWRAPCNNIERVDRLNAATITSLCGRLSVLNGTGLSARSLAIARSAGTKGKLQAACFWLCQTMRCELAREFYGNLIRMTDASHGHLPTESPTRPLLNLFP